MATTRNYWLAIDSTLFDAQRQTLATLIGGASGEVRDHLEGLQNLCDGVSDQAAWHNAADPNDSPDIVLALTDGAVTAVKIPAGCTVQVRDYDVPDDWENAETDGDGDRFQPVTL